MPTRGFTLWFTGLSGSGKSTLAHAVAHELEAAGRRVDVLDGDVVRQYLSKGLGFSKEDRDENIRRIGFVAHLITRHGGVAVTAAISPYRAVRDENRRLIGRGNFIEVYCRCPLAECERRDIKGLYKKARARIAAGEKPAFTGLDDPYEPPRKPEITVNTARESVAQSTARIWRRLKELGVLGRKGDIHLLEGLKDECPLFAEFVPVALLAKAEAAFRKARRVETDVLLKELHISFATAAQLIDKLAEQGKIVLTPGGKGKPRSRGKQR